MGWVIHLRTTTVHNEKDIAGGMCAGEPASSLTDL
jgi:hypothetical protein